MPRGRKKGCKPPAKQQKKQEEEEEEKEKKEKKEEKEDDDDFLMEDVLGGTDSDEGVQRRTVEDEEDEDDDDPLAALRSMAAEREREQAQARAEAQAAAQAQAESDADDQDASTMREVEDLCCAQARRRLAEERAGPYRAFFWNPPPATTSTTTSDGDGDAATGAALPALPGDARTGAEWADVLAAGFPVDRALAHAHVPRAAVEAWLVEAAVAPVPPAVARGAVAELARRLRTHGTLAAPLARAAAAVLAALRALGGCVACDAVQPVRSEAAVDDADPAAAAAHEARAPRVAAIADVVALLAASASAAGGGGGTGDVVPLFADTAQYLALVNAAVGLAADLQERDDAPTPMQAPAPARLVAGSAVAATLRRALGALVDGAGPAVDDAALVGVVLGRASLPHAYARTQTLAGRAGGRTRAVHRAAVWAVLHHCAQRGCAAAVAVAHARPPAPTGLTRAALLAFLAADAAAPRFGCDCDFGVVWRCVQDCVLACGFVGAAGAGDGADAASRAELERLVRLLEGFCCTYSAPAVRDQYESDADDFVDWLRAMLACHGDN